MRLALALGAGTVIAAARNKDKLRTLTAISCPGRLKTVTFSGDIEADTKALRDMTPHGKGADIYVDFPPFQAGGATHPLACISALKNGGIAMLCGDVQYELIISYGELMFKNLTIRGV